MAFVISYKYKFIFVHIPKTAGTSFATLRYTEKGYHKDGLFNQYAGEDDIIESHQHIVHARNILGNNFDSYLKFAIIRNPYHRAVSMFKQHWQFFEKDFSNYIDYIQAENIFECSMICWPAWYWIVKADIGQTPYQWDFELETDKLLLFENINEEIPKLLESFGINTNGCFLPHNRNSEITDYDAFYIKDSYRKIVEKVYERDFNLYRELLNNRTTV